MEFTPMEFGPFDVLPPLPRCVVLAGKVTIGIPKHEPGDMLPPSLAEVQAAAERLRTKAKSHHKQRGRHRKKD